MTAAIEGGEWSAASPGHTLPQERSGTHFTGEWVGPRAGLDGRKISSPPGFDRGPSSPAIPTELPDPLYGDYTALNVVPLFNWDRCSPILEKVYEGYTTALNFHKTDTTVS